MFACSRSPWGVWGRRVVAGMGAPGEDEGGSGSESGEMSGPIEGSDVVLSSESTTSCSGVAADWRSLCKEGEITFATTTSRMGRGWEWRSEGQFLDASHCDVGVDLPRILVPRPAFKRPQPPLESGDYLRSWAEAMRLPTTTTPSKLLGYTNPFLVMERVTT